LKDFESMALKHVPRLTHSETAVSVPKLYYEDRENRVMLLSDSGAMSTTLKALFQTNTPTINVSHIIGKSLGAFLARLHGATFALDSSGSVVKKLFDSNQTARRIASQVTYGTLLSTVAPKNKEPCLIEPPLDLSPAELNVLTTLATAMQNRIMTSSDVLAMGDFWPGNIMVSFTQELHLNVIDWETARPGLAGLEIGQFLAEMYSLSVFHPSCHASVDAAVSSFLVAYRDITLQGRIIEEVLFDIAWTAATHFGTHLVTWTPRVPWGTKEQTREVVLEGLNYLLRVADRNEAWLRTSIVRDLLP
jgi:5-methylthioribose kinase